VPLRERSLKGQVANFTSGR